MSSKWGRNSSWLSEKVEEIFVFGVGVWGPEMRMSGLCDERLPVEMNMSNNSHYLFPWRWIDYDDDIIGGGAPEMEVACKLREKANERGGAEQYCWRAFADALELVWDMREITHLLSSLIRYRILWQRMPVYLPFTLSLNWEVSMLMDIPTMESMSER